MNQSLFQKSKITLNKYAKVDIKVLLSYLILLISLRCSKYFVRDCLTKQIFGHNSAQSPQILNFLKCSITSKLFSDL